MPVPSPKRPDQAAEELAAYETRFGGIDARLGRMEGRLDGIDSRLGLMTWAVGINVALTLAVLAKLVALR